MLADIATLVILGKSLAEQGTVMAVEPSLPEAIGNRQTDIAFTKSIKTNGIKKGSTKLRAFLADKGHGPRPGGAVFI